MNIYQFHTNPESLDLYDIMIRRDAQIAWNHALREYKRFPEGEAAIAKDSWYAYMYAKGILRKRFPEAEEKMLKEPYLMIVYARDVIKDRWPEAEKFLLNKGSASGLVSYAKGVIKDRWPEAEEKIANSAFANEYQQAFNVKL
jgi:hypothetical protein